MDLVAVASPRPLAVVEIDRHRRVAALGVATAAAGRADEDLDGAAEDVDRLPSARWTMLQGWEVWVERVGLTMASGVVSWCSCSS